ncbi:type IV secretion system protein [Acinetobacter variabilis]|uniref:type IV secretion system protein n=1 Tax=Acinetobacter variabilis TaxID=70346 RepID=UPI0028B06EEF|nr:type IV secretion system protein [Acinetobacter variabilis]
MAFTFFTDLERNIDTMVTTVVTNISNNTMEYFLPVVSTGLGISILWMAVMLITGSYDSPGMDFVKKITVITIVVGFAGAGGLYQTQIMSLVLGLPSELASALVGGGDGSTNVLDIASEKTLQKTAQIFDLVGVTPSSWLNALVGIVFFVSGLFLIGASAVLFFISKVVVSILAGLGFIFIFTFLWEPIRNFFNNWVNQIVHYSLMLVLSSLFFGFLMGMYDRFIDAFTIGESNLLYTAFAIAMFTFIGYKLIGEIPTICQSLSNSVSVGSLSKSKANANENSSGAKGSGNNGGGKGDSGSGGQSNSPRGVVETMNAPFRGKAA